MVPLIDLEGHYASIKEEVDEATYRAVDNPGFILSKDVEFFEQEFGSSAESVSGSGWEPKQRSFPRS